MVFPKEECPPIVLHMFDKDPLSEEFIGSCLIDVQKGIKEKWISWKEDFIPKPVWHELEYGKISYLV